MKDKRKNPSIEKKCKNCQAIVKNVDSEAAHVICYRCTVRLTDPAAVFIDEIENYDINR